MDVMLDRDGSVPLYQQIERWLRAELARGAWREHGQLPAEHDLAAQLNVNRGTLRKAISNLMQEGLLERVHGKGTFVTSARLGQSLANSFVTFSELLLERRIPFKTKVLGASVVSADDRVATLLGVPEGTDVFCLERLRSVNDEPVVLLKNFVVHERCPNLEQVDFRSERLFDVIERDCGLTIEWGQRSFEAAVATDEIATLLAIDAGSAVMYAQQRTYVRDEVPVELSDLWFRGDRFRLLSTLDRVRRTYELDEILIEHQRRHDE